MCDPRVDSDPRMNGDSRRERLHLLLPGIVGLIVRNVPAPDARRPARRRIVRYRGPAKSGGLSQMMPVRAGPCGILHVWCA